ncbi:MAG: division/cell wall cluster transcriptional repressor MraZ [Dehalococcoidales bacterium]|nr:division/cell wall cluster transcriptional repressor MraZ [Dehalococcoidales bacterium]
MFFGEFGYKLDEKGRVPLPPKFRRAFEGGVVLAPGIERCINAYTLPEWTKIADSLTSSPVTPAKLRRLTRAIFATAFSTELDRQGRVALPPPLRAHAGIKDEVVIAGANNYLEIWSKELWDDEKVTSQQEVWQIVESLEKR